MARNTTYAILSNATKSIRIIMMREILDKTEAEKLANRIPGNHYVVEQNEIKDVPYGQYKFAV